VYLKKTSEIQAGDRAIAGDKAVSLGELTRAGINVPPGFCLTTDTYRDAIANPLGEQIVARIAATEIDDPVDLESAAEEIRAWIENVGMPPALVAEIESALEKKPFAVRASRVSEDVTNPAASGLAQVYLGIAGADAILRAIRQCWATPWNSRAIYFRQRKKIDSQRVTMAVVLQPIIDADVAGVMFTANPLTGATDEIQIDAIWGLGEAIIAARAQPDHFVVAKNDLSRRAQTIATKNFKDVALAEGGIQTIGVPLEQRDIACLSDAQITALAEIGKQVEAHWQKPQDIEWLSQGDKILLLQTRSLKKK
jgi:phosphoenolpyruvate synthase/pyruvate phosphate dikinase